MSVQVYVGNLSWSLSSDDLKKAFEKFGSIEESTLIQTAVEKRSKGYGFVTFEKAEDAEKAIKAMDGTELGGRKLQVALAKDRSKEPPNLTDDRVHVGNLPSDYSKEEFVKLLSSFGECKDFDVLDGNGKKFGYATFSSPDDAKKAVESLNASKAGGNVLEVMFARKRKPRRPRKKRNSNTTTTTQGDVIPNQLFVRHLPRDATKESITEKFKTFGSIKSVTLSKRRRFGFVTYVKWIVNNTHTLVHSYTQQTPDTNLQRMRRKLSRVCTTQNLEIPRSKSSKHTSGVRNLPKKSQRKRMIQQNRRRRKKRVTCCGLVDFPQM